MYAVMRLVKTLELESGHVINCATDNCCGMIPVFDTVEHAEEIYGVGVQVVPLAMEDDAEKNFTKATPPKGADDPAN